MIKPSWSDGSRELSTWGGTTRLPDPPNGSWDDARIGATGWLVFLKDDRLLQISFTRSSTDAPGAIRLARAALPRLALVGLTAAAARPQPAPPRPKQRTAFPQLDRRIVLAAAVAFALLVLLVGRGSSRARRARG